MRLTSRLIGVARWLTERRSLVPPDEVLRRAGIGGGDFVAVGNAFLEDFRQLAQLQPGEAVLEIGCGVGRMAVPLTSYLRQPGRYDGFDVVRGSVEWCQKSISRRFPNFGFHHLDVANTAYNPAGRVQTHDVTFPFPDEAFDLVIAISLFTHLLPEGTRRYLAETRRVLRPGGRLFATWFVWREEAEPPAEAAAFLPVDCGTHRVQDAANPEAAVGYREGELRRLYQAAGLEVRQDVPGHWSRGLHQLPYQDILVAVRPAAGA